MGQRHMHRRQQVVGGGAAVGGGGGGGRRRRNSIKTWPPLPLHPSLAARRRDERDQVSVSAAVNYLTEIHYQTTRS